MVFGVLSCVFGAQLLSLYSTDPAVIQVGLNRMYIVCGPYFLCGIMDVMTGVLRGVGYSLLPMIVSADGRVRFPHFLGHDGVCGQSDDGLPDGLLPRLVGADVPGTGRYLRCALEQENQAALYAGGIGGAIK
ncbi:MAG: MATE family efflux transporter [Christensenellales bacterium]